MAKKRVKPIRIGQHEVFNVAPGGGANGALLSMTLTCGNCAFQFRRTYSMAELSLGFPHETCENCSTVNYVPYSISGRNNAHG